MDNRRSIYSFLLLLLTLVVTFGCESTPDSFYQNDLAYIAESDVTLTLESAPDGSGVQLSTLTLKCRESASVFALLRNRADGRLLASMEVDWLAPELDLNQARGSEGMVSANKNGSFQLTAKYNQEFSLSAGLIVKVEDCFTLPIAAYEYFLPSLSDSSGRLKGRVRGIELFAQSADPVVEDDGNPYLQFSGAEWMQSVEKLGISGNSERTVIAVAMPSDFGRELSPYHPPVYPSPTMLGFGELRNSRSVYDFNFYGKGEFFTNFYGATQGYDDTYNYQSPLAERDQIQIFTSRYQHIVNQYYGQHNSYINGELGNQVWTRLETNDGPFSIGRGAFRHQQYTEGFQGRIYEVIIYNRALTDAELQQLHEFLMQKYNL